MHYREADRPEHWQLEQPEIEKGAYLCPLGIKIEQRINPQNKEVDKNAN